MTLTAFRMTLGGLLLLLSGLLSAQNDIPELELDRIISPGEIHTVRWSADRSRLITTRPGGVFASPVDNLPSMVAYYPLAENSRLMDTSPDNDRIIYMNDIGEIRLWDGSNNRRLIQDETISAIALGPDHRIAVADRFSLILWPAGEGAQLTAYGRGDSFAPELMRFSPGGSLIAFTGCLEYVMGDCVAGTLRLWETDAGRQVMRVDQRGPFPFIAFSDNGQQLYTQGFTDDFELTVAVYDTSSRSLLTEFLPELGYTTTADFSGDILAYGSTAGNAINLLNVGNSTIQATISLSDTPPSDIRFSPDGALLAVADATGLYIIDVASAEVTRSFSGHSDLITGIAFSPDSARIATSSWDSTVREWNATTGELLSQKTFDGVLNDMEAVIYNVYGKLFTAGTDLTIWEDNEALISVENNIHSAAYNPAQDIYATGTALGNLTVWNNELEAIDTFQGPQTYIRSLAFSESGDLLAFCIDDLVTIRDLSRTVRVETFRVESPADCQEVAITRDGRYVAAGVEVYDRETGESRYFAAPETDSTSEVVFSPDGRLLATANSGGTISIWDVNTLNLVSQVRRQDNVRALAFNNNGTRLVSGGGDGSVIVWRVP